MAHSSKVFPQHLPYFLPQDFSDWKEVQMQFCVSSFSLSEKNWLCSKNGFAFVSGFWWSSSSCPSSLEQIDSMMAEVKWTSLENFCIQHSKSFLHNSPPKPLVWISCIYFIAPVVLNNTASVLVHNTLEESKHFVNTLYCSEPWKRLFSLIDKRFLLLMNCYWKLTVMTDIVYTYIYSLKCLLSGNVKSICLSKM